MSNYHLTENDIKEITFDLSKYCIHEVIKNRTTPSLWHVSCSVTTGLGDLPPCFKLQDQVIPGSE